MKKNLKYEILESVTYVNPDGQVTHNDQKIRFIRGELTHEARKVTIFYENKRPVVLLTNNFEFPIEDISEIYRLRWAIESLYKHSSRTSRFISSMGTVSMPYRYRLG